MLKNKTSLGGLIVLMVLLAPGCATVSYVGNSFDNSTSIETYYSEDDIKKEYSVIGRAVGYGLLADAGMIHKKLIKTAKSRGADAILISGVGKSEVLITVGFAIGEAQVYASFLKYN